MKISCYQWVHIISKFPYDGKNIWGDHEIAQKLGCTLSDYETAKGHDLITITFKDPKKATFFALKYL